MRQRKVLLATGGTGGHIFPAEALADELQDVKIRCLFAGGKLADNQFFQKNIFSYKQTETSKKWYEPVPILKGIYESHKIINEFDPDIVVGFGSYYSFPVLSAAALKRKSIILLASDIVPGRVIRWFSPFAASTAIRFEETARSLKGPTSLVKVPLRKGFDITKISKKEAQEYFCIKNDALTLLLFGGSLGARFFNTILVRELILAKMNLQIIHITGNESITPVISQQYAKAGFSAVVKTYEDRMNFAWRAADISITRSGSVSTSEQLEFEVPGILIPYPAATDNHQDENADTLSSIGFTIKKNESDFQEGDLKHLLEALLNTREEKVQKIRNHKKNCGNKTLKDLVLEHLS